MIRFIDLRNQILAGDSDFAYYDTTRDRFLEFGGAQTWDSWEEFSHDAAATGAHPELINRCKMLTPRWAFTASKPERK